MISKYDDKEAFKRDLINLITNFSFSTARLSVNSHSDMFSTITEIKIKIIKNYEQT